MLFEALRAARYRIRSRCDDPYAKLSEQEQAVDLLHFPLETLRTKAGDCDDLSILYAALLESVGVEAAFITTPGHIFVAFNLGLDENSARDTFADPSDLILRDDGSVWIPVEVTLVKDGFVKAWKEGASAWSSAVSNGKQEFVSLQAAWAKYRAPNMESIQQGALTPPQSTKVFEAYSKVLGILTTGETAEREKDYQDLLKKTPNDAWALNKLGQMYARWGKFTEARAQFDRITRNTKDVPASTWVNLGNLSYLEGKYQDAFDYYNKALAKNAESISALLGKARAALKLKRNAEKMDAYNQLSKVSPGVAEEYAYLISGVDDDDKADDRRRGFQHGAND